MQKSRIQCYNCKEYGHVARECQKPKRAKDAAYHREKMLLCKQEEAGIQLNAEQADWKDDTDDESDDQELEAHYMYMAKIQKVSPDVVDFGPIFDTEPEQKTLPSNMKSILKNTNVLAPEMYKLHTDHTQARTSKLPQDSRKTNKQVSFSTGVIPTTSVSRPQLKSNPMGDRVLRTNSRGKKLEVEEHRRNVKLSKNKTSVTACYDSLNAKNLNVKSVYAMCDKCVLHDKHDMCVLKSVNKPIKRTLVEIVLFIVDSGCSKHMTGNLKLLINFMEKFLGTVKFGNDQIAPILGYGDLVQGTVTIKRVYYVEELNHNLFSVGQFCYADLEVAFRKLTCFIHDLKGNDLLI
nr:integrase, catalytic region, zinc finger, CCHC-type, peptidase aspartic, catalytic [Tanacetum cinerariifolium]